jgi:hypothetical protein
MNDTGTFKVTKSGGVDVTWSDYTRHYDSNSLCQPHLPDGDIPHWPLHMAEKSWATDVDKIVMAQSKVVLAYPKRFQWLRLDWEHQVRRLIAKEREHSRLCSEVERLIDADEKRAGGVCITFADDDVAVLRIVGEIYAERRRRRAGKADSAGGMPGISTVSP